MSFNLIQTAYNAMLLQSVSTNDLESVVAALRAGADINCVDSDGCTPAILAAQLRDDNIYNYLVSEGANLDYVDGFGLKAEDYLPEPEFKSLELEWEDVVLS